MYVTEKTTTDQLMALRRRLGITTLNVEAGANGRYVAVATLKHPDGVITLTGVGPTVAQAIDAVVIEVVNR